MSVGNRSIISAYHITISMNEYCMICGLPVLRGSMEDILIRLLDLSKRDKGAWIITLNTEMLARLARDPSYKELITAADMLTADGMPLVWASRLKGNDLSISERTTGVDLVHAFLQLAHPPRFGIIGGINPATTLDQYPPTAREACGYLFNGMVDLSDKQICQFASDLRSEQVKVLFIALGVPKQDQLAAKLREVIPELIMLGVGGTFEILGPTGSRAPRWMRSYGFEWLYRLIKEPRRLWRRYMINYPSGLLLLIRDTVSSRKS